MRGSFDGEVKVRTLLRSLEEDLLRPEVRKSRERINELLADEFVEFGSSGRVFDKAGIIAALQQEQRLRQPQSTQYSISDFSVRWLARQTLLVTYRLVVRDEGTEEEKYTLRSSIWQSTETRWKMIFHLGTPTKHA